MAQLGVGMWGGLNRFDPETERFTRFVHDPNDVTSLSSNGVGASLEDRQGRLWITTANGLNRMDRATGTFTRYLDGPGQPDQGLSCIVEDPAAVGVLWLCSYDGVLRFDAENGEYSRYEEGTSVSEVVWDPATPGVLWMATWEKGLARLETRTGRTQWYGQEAGDAKGLQDDNLRRLYVDRAGIIWIGTDIRGIHKFDPVGGGFRHLGPFEVEREAETFVYEILEDRAGDLWFGTGGGGLFRLDRETGRFEHFVHEPDNPTSLSHDEVSTLYEDEAGVLWLGTRGGGLNRLDRATGRFERFQPDPNDSTSLSGWYVRDIVADREGTLWIGTHGGLDRFQPVTGRFTHYVTDAAVVKIFEDAAGMLWLGTLGDGVIRFDPETESSTKYTHDPDDPTSVSDVRVYSTYEDRNGVLWFGTTQGGLNRMDRVTGTFTHYTDDDGLPDNTVYSILEDEKGRLWMGTDRGLSRFDPTTETFRTFGTEDGLPSSEMNTHAGLRSTRTGEMFFGTINGLFSFYPHWFESNAVAPQVVLTGFQLFNKDVPVGEGSVLERPIWETASVQLGHDQHSITLDYVGLHYKNPERNAYRYRLEPLEADWVEAGARRSATYTNLSPGDYTFRVTASNSDGVWNDEGASLAITILPPWWRTWWAYLLYGLLVIAAAFQAYRWQHTRIVRREREAARERELEQAREIEKAHTELQQAHAHLKATQQQLVHAEKMASLGQLTAGIAHEIKNPLNFITGFAEVNVELADELRDAWRNGQDDVDALLDDLKQNAQVIDQHGKRADGIVQAMMQHASGGTGEREAVAVNAFVEEYVTLAYHGKRAQTPGFNVEINRAYDEAVGRVEMIPQEIGRVLLNLLSNAFDAVHERADAETGGRPAGAGQALDAEIGYAPVVTVSTRRNAETVEIHIGDNGSGISKELREKIFEPFFTTKPTGSGTGLGLSLAYDIVTQGHGGTLAVESKEEQGATFVVTLPRT